MSVKVEPLIYIAICIILAFAYCIYLILRKNKEVNNLREDKNKVEQEVKRLYEDKERANNEKHAAELERDAALKKEQEMKIIFNSEDQMQPWLANLYADYEYTQEKAVSDYLRNKSHPAIRASDEVLKLAREKRIILAQCKMYEYQFELLRSALPWIEDYLELDTPDIKRMSQQKAESDEEGYDKYKNWLSPIEYAELPNTKKFQIALQRYLEQPKSNWEAGVIYERYIGYLYEIQGYKVEYSGALRGKEDMGRDIIAVKKNETLIIQCKRRKPLNRDGERNEIHENVVFQTYGSAVHYQLEHKREMVRAVIYTTTCLSSVAYQCAKYLNVEVFQNFPLDYGYPLIKCNISRNGEKIYHLPFDQQYDYVRIEQQRGEFYARTVAEAEAKGFRWHGNKEY